MPRDSTRKTQRKPLGKDSNLVPMDSPWIHREESPIYLKNKTEKSDFFNLKNG